MAFRALALVFLATACGDATSPDPGFCKMAEWGVDIIQNTSVTQMGGYSLEFVSGTTGEIRTDYIPVAPGGPHRATAWLRGTSIAAGNTCKADIDWYTAAKAYISSTNIHATGLLGAANVWEEKAVTVDAPATAAFACVLVEKVAEAGGAWTLYCDYAGIKRAPYSFVAYRNANQNLTTGDDIEFNDEIYDHGGIFDDVANYEATIPVDGMYSLQAASRILALDTDETWQLRFYRNIGGAGYFEWLYGPLLHSPVDDKSVDNGITYTGHLYKGDLVKVKGFHDHGAALNISGAAGGDTIKQTWFSVIQQAPFE